MSNTILTGITPYQTIVVYDTEFTTWDGALARGWSGEGEHRELVQIAAQKIDLVHHVVLDSFERLVIPRVNRQLSPCFTNLTGITQAQIEADGMDFADVYTDFLAWAKDAPLFSYSKRIPDYTDADVLQENITLYELLFVLPRERCGVLTKYFQTAGIDTEQYSSGQVYRALGITLTGQVHNAMHDVDSLVTSLFTIEAKLKNTN